jgi:membrane associated rhomboid family serine protease
MTGMESSVINEPESELKRDRKRLFLCMLIPFLFVSLMWISFIAEHLFNTDFTFLGIFPLSIKGLPGIFLSPFIHADLDHILNNTLPLFILGTALFYFYTEVAFRVFFWIIFFTGLTVWVFGRQSYHIGASGVIYGMASFLFFSGIIRRHIPLIALSLLVVFIYGQMVWGIFPLQQANISWESHMLGAVAGIFLAIWFRNEGPQKPVPFEDEDDENSPEGQEFDTDNNNMIN